MGHARYLIDVYGFDVDHGYEGNKILITENGQPIVGGKYMPGTSGGPGVFRVHETEMDGLMTSRYDRIDRYSAAAMNLIAGHRAVSGNFNAPQNLGVFMNDLPAENVLTLRDKAGASLPGASVKIYQSDPSGHTGGPYFKFYDAVPDLEFTADEEGKVLLGSNPFGGEGIKHGLGGSNAVAIVRVEYENRVGYDFLESTVFNLQFWSGNSDLGRYELSFAMIPSGATTSEDAPELPTTTTLGPNFPNPFRGVTTIPFELSEPGMVTLTVLDLTGRRVAMLLEHAPMSAGLHRVEWAASTLSSGTYLYRLKVNGLVRRGSLTLLR